MSGFLSILEIQYLPLLLVIVSFGIIILYLLYEYEDWGIKKHTKVTESYRQDNYECPRCRALVDSESTNCPECGATFETDIYGCPVCGTKVQDDHEECPDCGESFIIEKTEFECPNCSEPVDRFDTGCDLCGAEFWSPVKRSNPEDDKVGSKPKKIDPTRIKLIDD